VVGPCLSCPGGSRRSYSPHSPPDDLPPLTRDLFLRQEVRCFPVSRDAFCKKDLLGGFFFDTKTSFRHPIVAGIWVDSLSEGGDLFPVVAQGHFVHEEGLVWVFRFFLLFVFRD